MHQVLEHFEETRSKINGTIVLSNSRVSFENKNNDAPFPHSGKNTP